MKKIRLSILLGMLVLSCSLIGCSFNSNKDNEENNGDIIITEITDDVTSYNDSLVDITNKCFESEANIRTATSATEVETAVNSTISTCESVISEINELEPRENDSSLQNAVIPVIQKEIEYRNKFLELVPFYDKDLENLTEDDANNYETIRNKLEAIDTEIASANEILANTQVEFAANHGYELSPESIDNIDTENTTNE